MKLRGREDKDGKGDAKESRQCSSNVSGHGQFRGGKFSLPLRRFLSVSSQEEVLPGREVFQRLEVCVRRRCVTYARVKFEGKRN